MPTKRRSRVFTISMPPEMANRATAIARKENRTMSELMREAFRAYDAERVTRFFDEMSDYAKSRNPRRYAEEDIPRLIDEVRAETRVRGKAAARKRA